MNFFRAQDAARKNTFRLLLLFSLAVIALVALTNLLIMFAVVWYGGSSRGMTAVQSLMLLPAGYWLWTAIGVTGAVAGASLYKYLALRGGGRRIAEGLGGTQLPPNSSGVAERRLLNVVEEMAIASGMGVPAVYLLDDSAINAFAAGFSVDDAVIGVTRGALDRLNRDELQAVIGHEFSHILNGDTGLNLRLVAILHGILFIGLVGYALLRGGGGRGGRNAAFVLALAAGLVAIGFAGSFCGGLIKAGVSRQREYLADAAAVQFTRNPGGMSGALKKIRVSSARIEAGRASEVSHMFFAQAVRGVAGRLTATHPPIEDRIRAIEPGWDGRLTSTTQQALKPKGGAEEQSNVRPTDSPDRSIGAVGLAAVVAHVDSATDHQAPEQLLHARKTMDGIDRLAHDSAHDSSSAPSVVYALVMADEQETRKQQVEYIADLTDPLIAQNVVRLFERIAQQSATQKLTLTQLCLPALKTLSSENYQAFRGTLEHLIKMDQKIDLAEWVLHRVLIKELRPHFDGVANVRANLRDAADASEASGAVLGALARLSRNGRACEAFNAGWKALGLAPEALTAADDTSQTTNPGLAHYLGEDPNFRRLNDALRTLRRLRPLAKPKLLKACAAVVADDGHLCEKETALLHGIAATLDCPMPPLRLVDA